MSVRFRFRMSDVPDSCRDLMIVVIGSSIFRKSFQVNGLSPIVSTNTVFSWCGGRIRLLGRLLSKRLVQSGWCVRRCGGGEAP
jgi:hypothetical protein